MHLPKGITAIPVAEAVGTVLCHDITRIVPGQAKGPAFKKGHIIREEDVEVLLTLGKEHIYVFAPGQGLVHEDEAALRIARAASGRGIELGAPSEGRVTLTAAHQGLLRVNVELLRRINSIDEMCFATLHTGQEVQAGTPLAGTRVIPLMVAEEKLSRVEALCAEGPVVEVLPFAALKVGMVTTGSEVFHGRIKDGFGPVVKRKFERLGSTVFRQILVADDIAMTVSAIHELLDQGARMIVVTGGMSVDPDDQTPASIRAAGGEVVAYGTPVLPGAMFLLAWIGDVPVLGLPGCVMYHKASIFDLVAPRLLAGVTVTREDIAALGHGGFCAACAECRYPICPFGKGA